MSSVGDVLAILGLFERVAVELRSYKHAPAQFQNLSVELDLIQGTIRQILSLDPQDGAERDTLERIRAIALHCQPALQGFAGKMRVKESSLGVMRNSRSLSSIGKRLHWSMIESKDISDLRQTVMAEMGAITILLSASQMKSIHHLTRRMAEAAASSASLTHTCETIRSETSVIAQMVARTPEAISDLRKESKDYRDANHAHGIALTEGMGKLQANVDELSIKTSGESAAIRHYTEAIQNGVGSLCEAITVIKGILSLLATYSTQLVAAVGRNTAMLLNVANQLKTITRAIEAIPLHLTLPVVRLDDALGESWALPFQACTTYDSFYDILRCVVFANDRKGLDKVVNNQFSISLTKVGTKLTRNNWATAARAGMHIEQAVVVSRSVRTATAAEGCPYPGCDGSLLSPAHQGNQTGKECSSCGRWSKMEQRAGSLIDMGGVFKALPSTETSRDKKRMKRRELSLPSMDISQDTEWLDFRRIEVDLIQSVNNEDEARNILKADPGNAAAHTLLGLINLRYAHDSLNPMPGREAQPIGLFIPDSEDHQKDLDEAWTHFVTALSPPGALDRLPWDHELEGLLTPDKAEPWYLLGRTYIIVAAYKDAYKALQQAVYCNGSSTTSWTTVGVLYYCINQYRDSLDALARAIRLNRYLPEPWYNLFVLYVQCNQHDDARDALAEFLKVLPAEHAHYFDAAQSLLQSHDWDGADVQARFSRMMQMNLHVRSNEASRSLDAAPDPQAPRIPGLRPSHFTRSYRLATDDSDDDDLVTDESDFDGDSTGSDDEYGEDDWDPDEDVTLPSDLIRSPEQGT